MFSKLKSFLPFSKKSDLENVNKSSSPPLTILSSQINSLHAILGMAEENPDEILKRKGIEIYDEMEAKDPHLYAVYQTRKLAVSRIPWMILPASSNKRDIEIKDFVFTALDDARGTFSEDIFQLSDAIGKGFSVLEIIWETIKSGCWEGKYAINELVFHPQKLWSFQDRRHSDIPESLIFFKGDAFQSEKVPWTKVIHYAFDAQDSLYGRATFKSVYWHWWFKKEAWKWWIVFLEKFAGPTAIGKYPTGSSKTEQDALLSILESIQQETAVVFPDHLSVGYMEASRSGAASYREMCDACNAEISKAILGATQTVEEGRRGSYALSRAHSQVRQERVEADGMQVADIVQQQLVKPLVDFNFITESYPQFVLKYPIGTVDKRKGKTLDQPGYMKK